MRLAVFASGSGSNFAAIAQAVADGDLPAELALLVVDQPDCYAVERAAELGVPVAAFSPRDYPNKAAFETAVQQALQAADVDFVALAGYMRIVGPTLLAEYEGRMVNLHPALLPKFPGAHAIADALAAGASETGVTVHYVDAGVDTGPVIAQQAVPVLPGDDEDSLAERIHAAEHVLYPQVLADLAAEPPVDPAAGRPTGPPASQSTSGPASGVPVQPGIQTEE